MKRIIILIGLLLCGAQAAMAAYYWNPQKAEYINLANDGASTSVTLDVDWYNLLAATDENTTWTGTNAFTQDINTSKASGSWRLYSWDNTVGLEIPQNGDPIGPVDARLRVSGTGVTGTLYFNGTDYLRWLSTSNLFQLSKPLAVTGGISATTATLTGTLTVGDTITASKGISATTATLSGSFAAGDAIFGPNGTARYLRVQTGTSGAYGQIAGAASSVTFSGVNCSASFNSGWDWIGTATANRGFFMRAGGLFEFQDADASNVARATINSADGNISSLGLIRADDGTLGTPGVATGPGDIYAEDAIEADGVGNFGGAVTAVGVTNSGKRIDTPVTQVVDETTDTIPVTAPTVQLDATGAGPISLVSAPTIAAGATGQWLTIYGDENGAEGAIIIQDQGTLAGSNVLLGASTRSMTTGDTLILRWNGSDWMEVHYYSAY